MIGRTPPSEFQLFTGGNSKTSDLAIFYNIAVKNMQLLINHWEHTTDTGPDISFEDIKNEVTYNALAENIWKIHNYARNKNGYVLESKDKELIKELLEKLNDIRNYHAHVWHDNKALIFSKQLEFFVLEKFNEAKASCYELFPDAIEEYERKLVDKKNSKFHLFKFQNNKHYITVEGRIFFLSFFLTTGQMSRLLQQRKGSKRTDMPLFKVKHHIYKYFSQRDGASTFRFHHPKDVLEQKNDKERNEILAIRQAYKIISYLYDYPDYLADNENLSLMVADASKPGKLQKVSTVQHLLMFIEQHNLLAGYSFKTITGKSGNDNKEHERNSSLLMYSDSIKNYTFQLGFSTLYQLVIVCLKYDEAETLGRLRANLESICTQRKQLFDTLNKGMETHNEADYDFIINKANQRLRGSRNLTELGIVFFEQYNKIASDNKTWKEYYKLSTKISNKIRSHHEDWKELMDASKYLYHGPEAVIIYTSDFVEKTEQKFRAGNRFMFYAAHFLINHRVTPGWYWETEKFDVKETLTKVKEFHQTVPEDNYRLSIENDHITIGIPKDNTKPVNAGVRSGFHQFSIGPGAMRYLIAFYIKKQGNENINDFLAVTMKKDMEELLANQWGANRDFKLVEDHFLPEYLKAEKADVNVGVLWAKAQQRVKFIYDEWEKALHNKDLMKRADKNRIIMDCYRLMDWPKDNDGQIKFLRAIEYNQMSVCHYCVHEKIKAPGERKSKFDSLYDDLFKLSTRKPPIPKQVKALLYSANDLNNLMELAISDRKIYLEQTMDVLKDLPGKHKKSELIPFCRKLGLSVPLGLLSEEGRQAIKEKQTISLSVLPFPIHPIMVLKHFAPHAYKPNYEALLKTPAQANDVFKIFRDPEKNFCNALYSPHYDIQFIEKMAITTEDEARNREYKKLKQKWTKIIHTTMNEDAMLWWIAKKYLAGNSYTMNLSAALNSTNYKNLTVCDLFNETITMQLKKINNKWNKDDNFNGAIYVNVRMHQLDDVMFTTEKDKLRRLAIHYMNRKSKEAAFWNLYPETSFDNDESTTTDGTKQNPLSYETLREERTRIAQHAIYLSQYILDWERSIINKVTAAKTDNEKQAFLIEKSKQAPYLNFKEVMNLAQLDSSAQEILNAYRTRSFHDGIPLDGSFAYMARPDGTLGTLLGITAPLHQPKDRSKYKNME